MHSIVIVKRPCIQVCLVEHDGLTDSEIYEKATKVEDSSQLTAPFITPELEDIFLGYECHDLTDKIKAKYFSKHELKEAYEDIEESRRVVEKPKRTYRKKEDVK